MSDEPERRPWGPDPEVEGHRRLKSDPAEEAAASEDADDDVEGHIKKRPSAPAE